ncbi:MAG: hypothetical protein CVV64_13280 [Candidatus Wallbacteria bacterium HGW-Wallbacteria-1]|uniref:Uncharacterized protein n=1 Tax=Candidatus Wallbacteria bacterium HGW-Wallbacteria-1 TaxID=2013854 RepID=A0A2N1PMR3_9BACT|nr:MAG: hypothetical protein CVV64_13280 [Candidatus Wallbacteria bacterium HGW-Wallbacteria-1]
MKISVNWIGQGGNTADSFKRISNWLCILSVLMFFSISNYTVAANAVVSSEGSVMARCLLFLYDSAQDQKQNSCMMRQDIEFPANYLGMRVRYHDVAKGYPAADILVSEGIRAVGWWFPSQESDDPVQFWKWIVTLLSSGVRCLAMNGVSPTVIRSSGRQIPLDTVNAALSEMGLRAGEEFSNLPIDIEVVSKDPGMVEFERKLDLNMLEFNELHSINPENRVFLKLRKKSTDTISDAVVATSMGGAVLDGLALYNDNTGEYRQWRLNMFKFLSVALGLEGVPRPDVTTLSGSRIMYSHVDGDGVRNVFLEDRKSLASEILYKRIFKKFSSIPFSVSLITADVDTSIGGDERAALAGKRIFSLPNVEPASHTMTHPLIWSTESVLGEGHVELPQELIEKRYGNLDIGIALRGKVLLAYDIPGYSFDPVREIAGSCRFIEENLLPPGGRCSLVFWSGDCSPAEDSLKAAEEAGILCINGGDGRMDWSHPSYGYMAPLGRRVGEYYQIHTSGSNENLYTQLWTTDFGGFRRVIETFERSGSPIRVAPVNVYYHHYSGEREASVRALETVYEWCLNSDLAMIHASEYIGIVKGFETLSISGSSDFGWIVTDYGKLATIRFDSLSGTDEVKSLPDMNRSVGVLGYRETQNSLYVHLDALDRAEIFFRPADGTTVETVTRPFLVDSTSRVGKLGWSDAAGKISGFTFQTHLTGQGRYKWRLPVIGSSVEVNVEWLSGAGNRRSEKTMMISLDQSVRGDCHELDFRIQGYGDALVRAKVLK